MCHLFAAIPPITAFEKNGLKIVFAFEKPDPQSAGVTIALTATNSNMTQIDSFIFQAAVPKVCNIHILLVTNIYMDYII